jgi:hypothetical protein
MALPNVLADKSFFGDFISSKVLFHECLKNPWSMVGMTTRQGMVGAMRLFAR